MTRLQLLNETCSRDAATHCNVGYDYEDTPLFPSISLSGNNQGR